jgi:hypothetical protein
MKTTYRFRDDQGDWLRDDNQRLVEADSVEEAVQVGKAYTARCRDLGQGARLLTWYSKELSERLIDAEEPR